MSSLGKVIVLSGPSSSGKSTLSKAIQALLDVPYWHISLDMIWYMQPLQREYPNWYPTCAAELMKAFSCIVGMLSSLGINVIAEAGFLDPSEIQVDTNVLTPEQAAAKVKAALEQSSTGRLSSSR